MGQTLPKRLDAKSVAHIRAQTCFSPSQVRSLYKRYRSMTHGNYSLSYDTFEQGLVQAGLATDTTFIKALWAVFDPHDTGVTNLTDFCTGISVFLDGDLDDILSFIFQIYDIEGHGVVTKESLTQSLQAMGRALRIVDAMEETSPLPTAPGTRPRSDSKVALNDTSAFVDQVFADLGKSPNEGLVYEEFKAAVKAHPLLEQCATFFITGVCKDFFAVPDTVVEQPHPRASLCERMDSRLQRAHQAKEHEAIESL